MLRPNYMPTSLGPKNDPTFRVTTASAVFCLILKYARGHSFILSHTRTSYATVLKPHGEFAHASNTSKLLPKLFNAVFIDQIFIKY